MLLSLSVIVSLMLIKTDGSVCLEESPCYCKLTSSSYVDLRPLKAARLTAHHKLTTTYDVQLCAPFNITGKCENVMGCQETGVIRKYYSLGTTSYFLNNQTIKIENGEDNRTALVTLDCTENNERLFEFVNEKPKEVYNFKLKSPDVCIKVVPTPTTTQVTTTTKTTPVTNTTKITPVTNTTKITPVTNTTKITPVTNTTKITPVTNTTKITPPTNSTTVTTTPTSTSKPTTVTTAPKTPPTTTKPQTTTGKGGATTVYPFTLVTILLLSLFTNKLLR
ncbi:hypothetical protein Btru_017140 [Bulinus truncatus]|nr:hypothetical protein Btru_017140 [Bulinus truncatus]